MDYEVLLIRAAEQDYNRLDGTIKKQAKTQLRKLTVSPELGRTLGKKMGLDLTDYRSLHFYGNKYRIVYKVDDGKRRIIIVGIGRRERAQIYDVVTRRVGRD
jgi:mRNA interferase RelE/StbE